MTAGWWLVRNSECIYLRVLDYKHVKCITGAKALDLLVLFWNCNVDPDVPLH